MHDITVSKIDKIGIIKMGYARVSTKHQNLDRQLKKFKEIGIDERDIYTDKFTGKEISRPGFKRFLDTAEFLRKRGYEIEMYFDDISRFSRTSEEGQKLYYDLIEKGYKLIFIASPHINSENMKERLRNIQNIDMTNLGEVGEAIKNLVVAVIKFQVATEFDRVQTEREEIVRKSTEGLARPDVKPKLGKRILYPLNLKEVFERYFNKEISKSEVAKELIFKTKKGDKRGITRGQLYNNWNKYLEKLGVNGNEEN